MCEYKFFYDETFHDFNMILRSNSLSSLEENKFDMYIGVFLGLNRIHEGTFANKLVQFENEQKINFMHNISEDKRKRHELKSSDILKKQDVQYGLATFSDNSFLFYKKLFEILNDNSLYIIINAFSKIECMLINMINNVKPPLNYYSIIYSLTKFLKHYNPQEIIENLHKFLSDTENEDELKNKFIQFNNALIEKEHDIKRKKQEKNMLNELKSNINCIIFTSNKCTKFNFLHSLIFENFIDEVKKIKIDCNKMHIIIDKESSTYQAGKNKGLNIIQVDSKNSIQIRIVDYLCGFIGKIVEAMDLDENKTENKITSVECIDQEDFKKKRKLTSNWFDISEESFNLYNTIYDVLFGNRYPIINIGYYFDPILYFFAFLKYIKQYYSFEDFSALSSEIHAENCDICCQAYLTSYFNRFNFPCFSSSRVVNMFDMINEKC